LELNYRLQIAPWLFFTPDIQVVINPDGRSDINDALVIGFGVGTVL
jgi:carbohydrate-selective porin OprB